MNAERFARIDLDRSRFEKERNQWESVYFLQRVSIACYAKRCTSYRKSVRLTVWLTVRHTLV